MARPKLKKTRRNNIYSYTDTRKNKKYAYRYKYYDSLGKRKELYKQGFDSDRDAEVALAKIISETESYLKTVESKNITVAQWMDIWFEARKNDWAISTKKQSENMIKYHIKPLIGHYKLVNLDYMTYKREFIDELLKTKTPNTVKIAHSKFHDAINLAVRNEVLLKNRFTAMEITKKENNRKKTASNEENDLNFLNEDDLRKLLAYLKNAKDMTHSALIWTIALTGMRRGESVALRWKDVDLNEGTISVYETRDHFGQRDAKTKNSIRIVEIDESLVSFLDSYRKKVIEKKLAMGIKHKQDDYVFINLETLQKVGVNLVYRILKRAYVNKIISKQISPHGLRHSYATILCAQGVPIPVVAKMIGDTSATVMKYYAHSLKDKEKEAVQLLSKVLL